MQFQPNLILHLKVRPGPTQVEHITDATVYVWLLVLQMKMLARDKHSNLFGLYVSDEEKCFIKLTPWNLYLKL